MIKLEEVIVAEVQVGVGNPDDASRIIHEFWTTDGELLATDDPWKINNMHEQIDTLLQADAKNGVVIQGLNDRIEQLEKEITDLSS